MPAAILNLPRELLLTITEQVLAQDGDSIHSRINTLAKMTEISSFWRDTVIGCSLLWTSIYTQVPNPSTPPLLPIFGTPMRFSSKDFARVRYFLQRSSQSPIRLYIDRSWAGWRSLHQDIKTALDADWKLMSDILLPHMGRCRFISIQFMGRESTVESIDTLLSSNLPLLEELAVVNRYSRPTMARDISGPLDLGWPLSPKHTRLRIIRFSDPRHYLPKTLDVPWQSVSILDLSVSEQFWPSVYNTLARLPALKELQIKLLPKTTMADPSFASHGRKILLPLLERVSTNNPNIWLDITTPSVHSATFTSEALWYPPDDEVMGARVQARLTHSVAGLSLSSFGDMPLREITLISKPVIDELMFPILQILTQLEVLRFCDSRNHGKFLNRLAQLLEETPARSCHDPNPDSSVSERVPAIPPSLRLLYIEETRFRYHMFWDFPNLCPELPQFVCLDSSSDSPAGAWVKYPETGLKFPQCDGCRVLKFRCDSGSRLGNRCSRCEDLDLGCRFDTHPAVIEALETQLAVQRLRTCGLDVTWVVR
ncbi:hypothetical protein DL93DRAFT_2229684 [Clavulina sp. PMI_390]|nr:hypothetical protein DL93DRAFT_2229684 [Clavulina sp. PMI_390]